MKARSLDRNSRSNNAKSGPFAFACSLPPSFASWRCSTWLSTASSALVTSFMPRDPAGRYETIQWLMFQMGGIGPMFGQLGFFHKFAGKDYEDKRPRDRYVAESQRL